MIKRLRELAREADECEDPVRKGLILTTIKNQILEGEFDSETSELAMGPVSLDVDMARHHGWTDGQIERAWQVLSAVSSSEGDLARLRNGSGVKGGVVCAECGREFDVEGAHPYHSDDSQKIQMLLSADGVHVGFSLMGQGADDEPEIVCEECGREKGRL